MISPSIDMAVRQLWDQTLIKNTTQFGPVVSKKHLKLHLLINSTGPCLIQIFIHPCISYLPLSNY